MYLFEFLLPESLEFWIDILTYLQLFKTPRIFILRFILRLSWSLSILLFNKLAHGFKPVIRHRVPVLESERTTVELVSDSREYLVVPLQLALSQLFSLFGLFLFKFLSYSLLVELQISKYLFHLIVEFSACTSAFPITRQ